MIQEKITCWFIFGCTGSPPHWIAQFSMASRGRYRNCQWQGGTLANSWVRRRFVPSIHKNPQSKSCFFFVFLLAPAVEKSDMASIAAKLFQSGSTACVWSQFPPCFHGPRLMALCMPTPELTKDDERDELGSRWDFLAAGSRDEGSLGNSKAASDQRFSSLFYMYVHQWIYNVYIYIYMYVRVIHSMCIYICMCVLISGCAYDYANHEKLCTLTHAYR